MIKLYTHPQSPCAQKVRIVLKEKELTWEPVHVDLPNKENLRPEYLKLNPLGVVPTLVHDDKPVIESSIICEFLDDLAPAPPLRPADPHLTAQMRFWMKHIDTKLHPSCGALQWPLVMRPGLMAKNEDEREALLAKIPEKPRRERQRRLVKMGLDAPDVADAVGVYRGTVIDMENALAGAGPWLLGVEFSLADCAMAPYFQTLVQFGWQALYADDCRHVAGWVDRMMSRPSYQVGVAADLGPDLRADLLAKGEPAWPKIAQHLAAA